MPKEKNSKDAAKKARKAEKQSKNATKAKQKERKAKAKGKDIDSDVDDVDLDAVLAEYAKQQANFLKIAEAISPPPPPRSSSTIIASPTSSNEIFLFGGEHFNGSVASFSNALHIYLINQDIWRLVTSPNTPLPRSGHAWTRGGNTRAIYLFGGEFSSPKQGTFYHYNDFWRLDTAAREWTRLETKGKGPPARSGHRMTFYKNFIILYGGFQDTSVTTKYLGDVWLYDTQKFTWHEPKLPPAGGKPDPRSSFSLLPHDNGAVLFGGYSRIKAMATGKQTKGGGPAQRAVLKPMIHQDTWFLRIAAPSSEDSASILPVVRWERRKRPANLPNPARAGATMTAHKGRGILFGGVHDVEESEEGIESEFFDTLFAWNVERNRWFQLTLRRPKAPGKKAPKTEDGGSRRGRGKADEEELLRNLAALETGRGLEDVDEMDIDQGEGDHDSALRVVKEVTMNMPHPRFNAQLTVQGDVLYIYGGTYEKGDVEMTFDEMFAIDLGKLDGVKEIFKREPENWVGSDEDDSEDESDGEEYTDEEMEDELDEDLLQSVEREEKKTLKARKRGKTLGHSENVTTDTAPSQETKLAQDSEIEESLEVEADARVHPDSSPLPYPRPFETLRDFFTRTSNTWKDLLIEDLQAKDTNEMASKGLKELRKEAFERAEQRWWDVREEVIEEEDRQEEAGIGEVVGIEGRGGTDGGSGVGRRR